MISIDSIRTVVGIIGNVISFGLLLSPMPTFITIVRKKAVEQFSSIPYLATLLNCMMWVVYALPMVHPNNVLVLTINCAGFVIDATYISIFITFSQRHLRLKILGVLAAELAIFATILTCVLCEVQTYEMRTEIVGILCVIFGTARYASPLSIMMGTARLGARYLSVIVIQTNSVKYMPLSLSFVSFLNGVCWMSYAFLRFDIYILIPNGLGALLGAAQLILYFIFYRATPKDEPNQNLDELPEVAPTSAPDSFSCVTIEK